MLVVLYPNDHEPPHVHVVDADFTRRILAWIEAHRDALLERWSDLRLGRPTGRIED